MKKVGWSSILVAAMLLAVAALADAQQAKKIPRIGVLAASIPSFSPTGYREGLRDLGYIEGQTIIIEARYAEGNLIGYRSSLPS